VAARMSQPLASKQAADAQAYLAGVPSRFRRRGREYFAAGAVQSLNCVGPGPLYEAEVLGSSLYRVTLGYVAGEGWQSDCDCPLGFDCKHAVAAMLALLAGNGTPLKADAGPRPLNLEQALREKLGRPLTIPETKQVMLLRNVYRQTGGAALVYISQLSGVFPRLPGSYWDHINLGTGAHRDEIEWWSFLAIALEHRGYELPAYLLSVVDRERVEMTLREQLRRQEIERWQNYLAGFHAWRMPAGAAASATARTIAVRLRWVREQLEFETCEIQPDGTGASEFRKLKVSAFRALAEDYERGGVVVTPESAPLWQPLYHHWQAGRQLRLATADADVQRIVGSLLRRTETRGLVVGAGGAPLRWGEALHWQVEENANPDGDYQLTLVQAGGAPAPAVAWVLPGQPTLHVTATTVHPGPTMLTLPAASAWGQPQPAGNTALVPAPALETSNGLRLLQHLGAALPARLREKVQHVPMTVQITAKLDARDHQEYVRVAITASGAGQREQYTAAGWELSQMTGGEELVVFDRTALAPVPALVQASDLKWDNDTQKWRWRVTRTFADRFAAWLASLPAEFEVKLDKTLATVRDEPLRGSVRLDVEPTGVDWFDLKVVLNIADTTLTPEELQALLAARGGFVRVGAAGWRRLQFDLSAEDDAQLAKLGLSAADFTSEPQRLHALQLADTAATRFLPAAQVADIRRRASELKARVNPPLPATVRAELRPYQIEGYHFLAYLSANRFGGILADDMGLGKTLQALAWLAWLRAEHNAAGKPALVVCPKSVMDNWRVEAGRFTPGLRVRCWTGDAALPDTDLLVVNYTQLRLLAEPLSAIHWLAAVLDEGQYIKNPDSQTAKVATGLRAEHRLVLTGTPIENRLLDLWSLMNYAMPGILGPRARFSRQFDRANDPLARPRLSARVRPFLLRRTKAQVAPELPDRIEEDLLCEMEPAQRTVYRVELKQAQQRLLKLKTARDLDRERFNILTSLLRLRQICCHPALITDKAADVPSAKIEALADLLEPLIEEGHKVLVFSQFVGLIELLQPLLKQRQWPHFVLTGATEDRGELVAKFQQTDGPAVFLISLKAGGFGLNLTAANYVVLFDPWWNPAVENQAIDRTHRIGQTRHVNAYRLLIKDSVEEKIRQLQKTKSALAADVLGEERFAQSLTLDDLKFLLADASPA